MQFFFLLIASLLFSSAFSQRKDTIRSTYFYGVGTLENGLKEGNWKYYYRYSRKLYASGNYVYDKKTGKWVFFDQDDDSKNDPMMVINYTNNDPDGAFYYHNPYCKGTVTGYYKAGFPDSVWDIVHCNGLPEQRFYHAGKPTGVWRFPGYDDSTYWIGPMSDHGRNGNWAEIQNGEVIGGGRYVNDNEEGHWKFVYGNSRWTEGDYSSGQKEGYWVTYGSGYKYEAALYHNGVKEGPDSVWTGTGLEVQIYHNDLPDGLFFEYDSLGKIAAIGTKRFNPLYQERRKNIAYGSLAIPEIFKIDFIEQGLFNGGVFTDENFGASIQVRDSLLKSVWFKVGVGSGPAKQSSSEISQTVCCDFWQYYYQNGRVSKEGEYLPLMFDSTSWDSTNYVEDPNNPGTVIQAPLKFWYSRPLKTGWWNYYNEQGVLLREERYENGELVEIKKH